MRIGFYIDSLAESEETKGVYTAVNNALADNSVSDASIFYNKIGYNSQDVKCGVFNSTDIWSFSGTLVCFDLNNLNFVDNVVNKINKVFIYSGGTNVIGLIQAKDKCIMLAHNEKDASYIYRVTGKKVSGIVDNYNIEQIMRAISQ